MEPNKKYWWVIGILVSIGVVIIALAPHLLSKDIKKTKIIRIFTNELADKWFRINNWFCYPNREDVFGVKRLPNHFKVKNPIDYVQTSEGKYYVGMIAPGGGGATVQLKEPTQLPKNECPAWQKKPLAQWLKDQVKAVRPLSKERFNEQFGENNWKKHPGYPFAIIVKILKAPLSVEYPMTNVDSHDGLKYGVGEVVSPGGGATIWLAGNVSE